MGHGKKLSIIEDTETKSVGACAGGCGFDPREFTPQNLNDGKSCLLAQHSALKAERMRVEHMEVPEGQPPAIATTLVATTQPCGLMLKERR